MWGSTGQGHLQDSQDVGSVCWGCAGGTVLTGCSPRSTHPLLPNPSTAKAFPSPELPTPLKALKLLLPIHGRAGPGRQQGWSWSTSASSPCSSQPWLCSLDLGWAEGEQDNVSQVSFPISHPILPLLQPVPGLIRPSQPTQPPPLAFPLQGEHLSPPAWKGLDNSNSCS